MLYFLPKTHVDRPEQQENTGSITALTEGIFKKGIVKEQTLWYNIKV